VICLFSCSWIVHAAADAPLLAHTALHLSMNKYGPTHQLTNLVTELFPLSLGQCGEKLTNSVANHFGNKVENPEPNR